MKDFNNHLEQAVADARVGSEIDTRLKFGQERARRVAQLNRMLVRLRAIESVLKSHGKAQKTTAKTHLLLLGRAPDLWGGGSRAVQSGRDAFDVVDDPTPAGTDGGCAHITNGMMHHTATHSLASALATEKAPLRDCVCALRQLAPDVAVVNAALDSIPAEALRDGVRDGDPIGPCVRVIRARRD